MKLSADDAATKEELAAKRRKRTQDLSDEWLSGKWAWRIGNSETRLNVEGCNWTVEKRTDTLGFKWEFYRQKNKNEVLNGTVLFKLKGLCAK